MADKGRVRELALLTSGVLEVTAREPSRKAADLHAQGIRVISDLMLVSRTFSSSGGRDAAVPPQDGNLPVVPPGAQKHPGSLVLFLRLRGSLMCGGFHFEFKCFTGMSTSSK